MYEDPNDRNAPWLGFSNIQFTPIIDPEDLNSTEECTQRASDNNACNQLFRERCVWSDLEDLDKGDSGSRRSVSCSWATSDKPDTYDGDREYNCNEFGRYFTGSQLVNNYHSELVSASGGEDNADAKITDFIVSSGNATGFRKFTDDTQCIWRDKKGKNDKVLEDGCLKQFDSERLPRPPGIATRVYGKGTLIVHGTYGDLADRTGDTNIRWGTNLIVTDLGEKVTVEGKPEREIEGKLRPVLVDSYDIELDSDYDIFQKPSSDMTAVYVANTPGDLQMVMGPGFHNTDGCKSRTECSYSFPSASCSLRDGKMIVPETTWLSNTNITTGPYVQKTMLNHQDADPKNTRVECKLNVRDGEIYKGDIRDDGATLQKHACDSYVTVPNQTIIEKTTEPKANCLISPDFSVTTPYRFATTIPERWDLLPPLIATI